MNSIMTIVVGVCGVTLVSGINLQITPQTVVLLSQSPPQTSFLCNGMSAPGIAKIYDIILSKIDQNGNQQVFASAEGGVAFKTDTAPTTLKKPTPALVSGGIDTNTPTSSTLKVYFETNEMVCADAGTYKCSYTYKRTDNRVYSMATQTNLSVHAMPSEVTLTTQKGGQIVVGTLQTPLEMDINESIQFTCSGKIGSQKTNLLRYKMSSLFDDTFNMYPANVNQGSTSTVRVDCSYTRSSSMAYVVQDVDTNRENYLAFKCYVTDQPPNQGQVTQESSVFYIKVSGTSPSTPPNICADTPDFPCKMLAYLQLCNDDLIATARCRHTCNRCTGETLIG